ncbi:hypothetical protein NLM59_09395 [Weeksellaceae bacterium KMM 9724]|uniref:hypothetical protein n=1 Tax=Profundicola chukchiensis TaxID=2961959 RepID=UPI0024390C16|nr:hypothetical protein [Profundicola chukchiensis]MDG4951141.1 hypothetical protein [Profundicola chukchiensis]
MKTIKLLLIFLFALISIAVNAQQTICSPEVKNYTVDVNDPSPAGSYEWTLLDEATTDLSVEITNADTNSISIDWSSATLDAYPRPHTFTLTVVETVDGCSGEPQEIQIILQSGYEAPTITAIANAFCVGDIEFFNLTGGTPNAQVTYTITSDNAGFTPINATVVLGNNGDATIAIPGLTDANTTEVFTLTLTEVDDETDTDSCSALILDPADSTMSVTVNPIPTTTEIIFD